MWIVTQGYNNYDQHGEYFVCAFHEKPTKNDLMQSLGNLTDDYLNHLLKGGGRLDSEDYWYFLTGVSNGEIYLHKNN